MFTVSRLGAGGVSAAIALMVSGCMTTQKSEMSSWSAEEKAKIIRSVPAVNQNKSVLVVRVRENDSRCSVGSVKLAPVINGKLEPSKALKVGHGGHNIFSKEDLADFGKQAADVFTLNFSEFEKKELLHDMKTSFVSIPPGDYVAVHVRCDMGKDYAVWMDEGSWSRFRPFGLGSSKPVTGDNFISVPPGKIVDAGILEMHTAEARGWFGTGKATLVGHQPSSAMKQELQAEFPGIYAKAVFSRFSPWQAMKP